jgi:hypothetical protein
VVDFRRLNSDLVYAPKHFDALQVAGIKPAEPILCLSWCPLLARLRVKALEDHDKRFNPPGIICASQPAFLRFLDVGEQVVALQGVTRTTNCIFLRC